MTSVSVPSMVAENPYPGLRPFTEKDARHFFGRDRQIDELLERLSRSRFCAIVGLSGSGKSSLVLAGLIPALRRGYVARSRSRWRIATCRPGDDPIAALSQALQDAGLESALGRSSYGLTEVAAKLGAHESLLVVVDQFEELFRYKEKVREKSEVSRQRAAHESARAADFVRLLLTAANSEEGSVYVVLTMRSDYLGDCARFRGLPEALNGGQYLIPRMSREQRREAIVGPVAGCATRIAPRLVQRLLNEIGDEPNHLPVLQHALMRMWELHDKSRTEIDDVDYATSGGLEDALNRHAEGIYNSLTSDEERKLVEWIFKRLTQRGHSERDSRDPARLADLWAICGAETEERKNAVTTVVEHFRQTPATFLTSKDERLAAGSIVDITHESLIEKWQRLRDWVDEESAAAKVLLRLADDAQAWRGSRRAPLRGLELADAESWNHKRNPYPAWALDHGDQGSLALVEEYLSFSRRDEDSRLRRQRWRLWGSVAAVGGVLLLVFAWKYHDTTVEARKDSLVEKSILDRDEAQRRVDAILALLQEGSNEQVRTLAREMASLQKSFAGQQGEVQELQQRIAEEHNALAEARARETAARGDVEKLSEQNRRLQDEIVALKKGSSVGTTRPAPEPTPAVARETAAKVDVERLKDENRRLRDQIGDLTKASGAGATRPALEPTPAIEREGPARGDVEKLSDENRRLRNQIGDLKKLTGVEIAPQPSDPEIEGVIKALYRYRTAFESMSTNEIHNVWPSISKPQLKKMEEVFKNRDVKAIHLHMICREISVSGEAAECDCDQMVTYTTDNKVQKADPSTSHSHFKFTKKSGTWHVEDSD